MKNTRIIQAYDTVSPTDAQKQNMRSALEGKLRDAEKPRDFSLDFTIPETPKPAENTRKPNYQSVKSAKPRRSLFPILAAVLAVAVAGGLFLGVMNGKLENSPSYAPPTTAQTVPVPEETQAGALPEGYQEIVDTYGKAVEEGWDATKCMELGICYMVKDIDRLDALGYALCDLDEDGSEELIITDGELIYDLYTLNSRGETLELAQSIERDRFYLSKANIIAEVASSGASSSTYHFAKLNETQLKLVDAVIYSAGYDPENPWFRGESQVPITEEEANAILDTYPHLYIPHTTLSGTPPMPEAALPDEETLNGYAQQLTTLLTGATKENYRQFCFLDFYGDGEVDLFLGSGGSVYATLEAEPLLFNASGAAYPCEDRVMECVSYAQGYTQFTYRKYGGEDGGAIQDYLLNDGESWYRMDENDNQVSISEGEAKAIQAKYKRLNLPWKKMDQFPVPIPDGDGVTLSPLFVNIFLPFAGEGKTITEEELEHELANLGMGLETGEGTYYVEDIGRAGAYLSTPMGDISSMTYTISGDFGRFVRATIEEDGIHYYLGAYLHEYPAESVEALQQLIQADNDTISLWRTAESYAMEYFGALAQQEREAMSKEQGREIYPVDYSYNIQAITGLNIWKEQFAKNGSVEIDIAAYVDSPDSFTWLTMKCEQVDGAWQVTDAWLQK